MPESHRCLDWPELEGLLELAPEAAARQAIAACPRCQARLAVLAEFVSDRSTPAGARPGAAAGHLRQAIAVELAASAAHSGKRPGRGTVGYHLLQNRFAWGLAAVLALALLGVASRERWFAPDPVDLLRGEPPGDRATLQLLTPVASGDGTRELRWRAQVGATRYVIQILDADLRQLAEYAVRADTTLTLAPGALAATAGSRLGWRVTAYADGDPLAVSGIAVLRLP